MFASLALRRGLGGSGRRLGEPATGRGGMGMELHVDRRPEIVDSPSERSFPQAEPMKALEKDIEQVLISTEDIQRKTAEVGAQISEDYAGKDLLLVGVLKGAFVVMADLARYIRLPLEFDFMAVSSYGAATKSSGVVRILKDLDHDLEALDVLVVEDIVDSGLTLKYLLKNLAARKPGTLEVMALLRKSGIQQVK